MKAATAQHEVFAELVAISIHAAREGGDPPQTSPPQAVQISIHAAREGGDFFVISAERLIYISIHAAREGGDFQFFAFAPRRDQFQSTPPVKAATFFFLIRQPEPPISIHAAREGGDAPLRRRRTGRGNFNPRRP